MYFLFTFPHILFSLPFLILFCTVVPKKQSWNTCHPYKYIMFINRPLIALLHAAASVYHLQYGNTPWLCEQPELSASRSIRSLPPLPHLIALLALSDPTAVAAADARG